MIAICGNRSHIGSIRRGARREKRYVFLDCARRVGSCPWDLVQLPLDSTKIPTVVIFVLSSHTDG